MPHPITYSVGILAMADDSLFILIEEDLLDEVEDKIDAGEDVNQVDEVIRGSCICYVCACK